MPIYNPPRLGLMLKTGQTTQYNSEPDDGLTQKGLTKSYTVLSVGQYSGNTNIDLIHLQSSTGDFNGTTHTYTDAGKCGVFKAAGGEVLVISGSSNGANNGTFTTVSATANAVVVTAGFATVAAGDAIVVKKREVHANACVQDNNTGLMWQRTWAVSMGTAGDGRMPVTGTDYDMYQYVAACNAALLSGYSDWRIPNVFEVFAMARMQAPTAVPDSTAFPAILNTVLWTSTTCPASTGNNFAVSFNSGSIADTNAKASQLRVWLVRGG